MIRSYQMGKIFMVATNIINCLLTVGIVVFACLQWKCSDMQRKTELFKYRVQHIQDLKAIWKEMHKNIDYIRGYRADYIIPENYSNVYDKLFKTLDDHLAFTRCYFDEEIYKQEQKFIELLPGVLPVPSIDATIYHMNRNEFEIINEEFIKLCNACLNTMVYKQ